MNQAWLGKPPKQSNACTRGWGGVFVLFAGVACCAMYTYTVLIRIVTLERFYVAIPLALVVFACLLLLLVSYWKTHSTPAPVISEQFKFSSIEWSFLESRSFRQDDIRDEVNTWASKRGVRTRAYNGQVNICLNCRLIKPERTHHCSSCQKCIARMDHHCPFFGNCIHFGNFKFFLLTLFYASFGMLFVGVSTVVCSLTFKDEYIELTEDPSALTVYIMLLVFSIMTILSVGGFFCVSFNHALHNSTTLEHIGGVVVFADGSKETYDLGSGIKNLKQLLGSSMLLWLFPVHTTPGDGFHFPVRSEIQALETVNTVS